MILMWIDQKYANLMASYVRNFKRKNDNLFNFSCVFCNDSSKNKLKARGYLFPSQTGLIYHCHNCSVSTSFANVLKIVNPILYQEYVMESYKESRQYQIPQKDWIPDILKLESKLPILTDSVLNNAIHIPKLNNNHIAVQYLKQRKIPDKYLNLFYYTPVFKEFVNHLIPNKFQLSNDCPRIIIPYFNQLGKCFAFQGRSLGNEQPKYYTIKLDDNEERLYGLDRIDYTKPIIAVEGPLDSIFLDNAVAVSGASFQSPTLQSIKSNLTIVFDNDRKNPQIIKLMKKIIQTDYAICIWPNNFQHKDINEAILNGYTANELMTIITNNTFKGPEALLRLSFYNK